MGGVRCGRRRALISEETGEVCVSMTTFTELGDCLQAKGIGSYYQSQDRFVVSSTNPALPSSNCFWVARRHNAWYIGTWLPAIYEVPADENVCKACELVFRSSATAIYTIEASVAELLRLRRLGEEEIQGLQLA